MAIDRQVYKVTRIVTVRFQRAKIRPPGFYAPDPDDRGYTGYEGPVAGLMWTDKAVMTVVRQLLDENAPLYVSSSDSSKLWIISPPAGTPLPIGRHADVRFQVGNSNGDVKLQVRAQAQTGPIVAELTVHVSPALWVECAIHLTAIYTPIPGVVRSAANTTNRTVAGVGDIMREINRQWRPAGVQFIVDTRKMDTNLTNQVPMNTVNPTDGILLCPIYGSGVANTNFGLLMGTNKVADRLNIYFVKGIQAANPGGGAAPSYIGFGSSFHRGCVIADNIGDTETTAHTVAHELGHILTLAHMGHTTNLDSHSDDDPQYDNVVTNRRHDLWSRRRLMYYMVGLQPNERTGPGGRYSFAGTDVGYGSGRSGHMITVKNLTKDPTDNEYSDARREARNF